jgi:hypothetical protein
MRAGLRGSLLQPSRKVSLTSPKSYRSGKGDDRSCPARLPRTGVWTVRRGNQAGYATIYAGVEDSVTEYQEESLQNCSLREQLAAFNTYSQEPGKHLVQNYAIGEISPFLFLPSLAFSVGYGWPRDCTATSQGQEKIERKVMVCTTNCSTFASTAQTIDAF